MLILTEFLVIVNNFLSIVVSALAASDSLTISGFLRIVNNFLSIVVSLTALLPSTALNVAQSSDRSIGNLKKVAFSL